MSDLSATHIVSPLRADFQSASRKPKKKGLCSEYSLFVIFVCFGVFFTFSLNYIHDQATVGKIGKLRHEFYKEVLADQFDTSEEHSEKEVKNEPVKNDSLKVLGKEFSDHELGGLSCEKYGGPFEEKQLQEMIYWSDIPSDSDYESPFKAKKKGQVKYMTFEPDGGGWNNIRMAMETVIVMAHATGRTLVMPPEQGMYLLRKDRDKQKSHFSFADFFHLDTLHMEHSGIDIITMEEYLEREAMTGNLRDKDTGEVMFPPNNRTDWNGENHFPQELKDYLRQTAVTPLWRPDTCFAAFPEGSTTEDNEALKSTFHDITHGKQKISYLDFMNKPVAVNASPEERMKEILADRKEMCTYDEDMQEAHVVHFMCYHKERIRLLVHFYAFLYFESWQQDLWAKRFVRDHLRYIDELQCAAARIINAIRERVKKKDPKNKNGDFDSMHVRRGDFQYKMTRITAREIYDSVKDKIPEKATVFIGTDERTKGFFDPLKQHYDILFLDDFKDLIKGINSNYYGMLDQLVASKGRTFYGTYFSTFTGFINRMRGYHSVKNKLPGYKDGIIESYYFVPKDKKDIMKTYHPVKRAFYAREFPVSWRDIDMGIGDLGADSKI